MGTVRDALRLLWRSAPMRIPTQRMGTSKKMKIPMLSSYHTEVYQLFINNYGEVPMKRIISYYCCCLFLLFTVSIAGASPVDENTARQVALNWMSEKAGYQITADKLTTAIIEKSNTDTLYYVINLAGGGWAIVSGDNIAFPIIAYSYHGTYSLQDHPVQFDQWMATVSDEIRNAIQEKSIALPVAESAWGRLNVSTEAFSTKPMSYSVAPLLSSTWDQGTYYNASCPADAAGPGGVCMGWMCGNSNGAGDEISQLSINRLVFTYLC